jgi:hypothetical protein
VGGENMKQIKLTMGKTMEKPWILRYFKDVLSHHEFQSSKAQTAEKTCQAVESVNSVLNTELKGFDVSKQKAGQGSCGCRFFVGVSIERDLDFVWIGFW